MLKSPLGLVRADTLHAAPVLKMLVVGVVTLGVGLGGHYSARNDALSSSVAMPSVVQEAVRAVQESSTGQAVAKVNKVVNAALDQPEEVVRETEVTSGQLFSDMLTSAGVDDADASAAMNALAKVFSLKKLRAGQDVSLTFDRTAQTETLTKAVFQPEDTKEIVVARQADGSFAASAKMIPVVRERVAARGEIRSSVFAAGERAGVPYSVMAAMIRIYAHSVDFQRDIRPGDSFEVLYDQPKTVQGKAVGSGSVIYAAMHIGGRVLPIYRVTFADKTVDYFDAKGRSVRRALLRTPLAVARVTSRFGMRTHPILGYSKMHKGVDFGAPTGTPIFAAGGGVVEAVGFKGGYGRYIRIRHSGGYKTVYGHMSRFNPRLYRGARVKQGQVIAYVGSSGRSTGPHLHFEVLRKGKHINPLNVKTPIGRVLEGAQLAQFKNGQKKIQREFSTLLAKQEAEARVKVSQSTVPSKTSAN